MGRRRSCADGTTRCRSCIDAQNERVTDLGRQIARSLPQRSGTAIAITNVALFDSERGESIPNATVVFHGERVVAAGGAGTSVPSDARRIDGTDKALLPGLWNMHMHTVAEFGPRLLAEGVTTIRDPGNEPGVHRQDARRSSRAASCSVRA